ncbi:hypothetical protein [Streptomyces sp. NPDC127084]|uniref:hypothetical protein n=1 Tax=Streptomyces sp. NPDC127084 TaxID=3347133 RepID=UPI00365DA4A3
MRLEVCRCRVIVRVALSTWTDTVDVPTGQPGETRTIVPTTGFADLKQPLASTGTAWRLWTAS